MPVYADSVAEEMIYVLDHAGVRFAVCQDQEQVDKVASVRGELSALETLVYDEPRGPARARRRGRGSTSPTCRSSLAAAAAAERDPTTAGGHLAPRASSG